jgi:hypothetical protein
LTQDAVTLERTRYGELFEIRASLSGTQREGFESEDGMDGRFWNRYHPSLLPFIQIREELDEVQGIPTSSTGKG